MILHLDYQIDKEHYKKIFFDNIDKGGYHKEGDVVLKYWYKVGIKPTILPQLKINHLNMKIVLWM